MIAARHAGLHRLSRAVLLAAALLLAACFGGGEEREGEAGGEPANPLLYEIAAPDGTVEGWLIGTIHALPGRVAWRTPAVDRVLDKADLLVVEVAQLGDARAAARMFAEIGTAPGLPPLADRLGPADRAALGKLLARAALAPGDLASHETWSAALVLSQVSALGDPANGVDRALIRAFAGRKVRELEGARAQLAIFDALPEREQRDLLSAVLAAAADTDSIAQAKQLQRAWIAGDADAITAATTTGMMADPELRAALLTARNARWLARIEPLLSAPERPLIAVGAAHLFGPDGLIAGLEARRFAVRRMPRS